MTSHINCAGYTGDSEKASWIKLELGFDWAFNYKTQDLRQTLKIAAPKGVDIFVDAVGGSFHQTVFDHMNFCGRIIQLGNLSYYSDPGAISNVPANDMAIALKVCWPLQRCVRKYHHLPWLFYLYYSGASNYGSQRLSSCAAF